MKRHHTYSYIATTREGKTFSISAPNTTSARTVAVANSDFIETLYRVFKRGGELSRNLMRPTDHLTQWYSEIMRLPDDAS